MSDIVFKIGPRINASGRMENGRESVDLLVEKDFSHALAKAKHIDEYNEQRKDIDKQMTEEANSIVSKLESQRHRSSIVLYDENWKKWRYRYRGITTHRNLLPTDRRTDTRRRLRYWFSAKRDGL